MIEEKIEQKIESNLEILEESLKYELATISECLSRIDTIHYLIYLKNDLKKEENQKAG
ncbi:MAG: hypothetical protein MJ231_00050 [bacterium]|nr:hypothetical protein [bacterium]